MHPSFANHVYFLRKRLQWAGLVVLLGLLGAGCESDSPPPERLLAPADTLFEATDDERDAAIEALDQADRTALDTTFQKLEAYAFERTARTEQYGPADTVTAFAQHTTRHVGPDASPEVLRADSAGRFEASFLDRFFATDETDLLPDQLIDYAVPDEPAYRSERERESFRYRLRVDTLATGHPVEVVDVVAQPGELGADQSIRYARIGIDPDTQEIVSYYIVHSHDALLFDEDSRFFIALQPVGEAWLPHYTRFRARVGAPLRAPLAVGSAAAYYTPSLLE